MGLALRSFAAGLVLCAGAAHAAACDTAEFRQFDFWLGEWNVYGPAGKLAGTNSITREYAGCVVHEHYTTPGPYTGESLNTYDAQRKVWHQTWVDNGGTLLLLDGHLVGNAMVLEGAGMNGSEPVKHRITWTPNADGTVRQFWQTAGADGKWKTTFDGLYRKK